MSAMLAFPVPFVIGCVVFAVIVFGLGVYIHISDVRRMRNARPA